MMISGTDLMHLTNFPSARLIAIFNIKLWKSGPLNATSLKSQPQVKLSHFSSFKTLFLNLDSGGSCVFLGAGNLLLL